MNTAKDWNPDLYLRYAAYRARPADDLLPRLELKVPGEIFDLGCGPGTLTKRLKDKWPERKVTGVDSSPEMLAEARKKFGDAPITWVAGDIATWRAPTPAALIFANASLHWIHNHEQLIPRLFADVAPGGVLVFQQPMSHKVPYHQCIHELIQSPPWRDKLKHVEPHPDPLEGDAYYDLLAPQASLVDVWETHYFHVLRGDAPVAEWFSSTGLVPFLSVLPKAEHAAFVADYAERTKRAYPPQQDGSVILVMPRLFVLAVRKP